MASQVNDTIPVDNQQVAKSDLRENFTIIKNEITALQSGQTLARRIALGIEPVGASA